MTITMTVTEEHYNNEIVELKKEISTGKHQREMMDYFARKKGLLKYKAFIQDVEG